MNVHEYQAKSFLKNYGLAVPRGAIAYTPEQAEAVARDLSGPACVIKAQIHASGRGRAGGVKVVRSVEEIRSAATQMLGTRLATALTGSEGKTVKCVLIEEAYEIARELYLAVLVDRSSGRVAIMASRAGGEDIEETAARSPQKILKLVTDPAVGIEPDQADKLATDLGLDGEQRTAAADIVRAMYKAFVDNDASLIEINPLAVTASGKLVALDVKMSFDDNALYRHEEIERLRDADEADPTEREAARNELNYVNMDGDIGCMVNGAGLALATLDIVKQYAGNPANFMDIRPTATREQIANGFKLLVSNPNVKAILVNVYGGGILRCDTVAEAVGAAIREVGLRLPLVVRVAGTNMEVGKKSLINQGIPVKFADDMASAAQMVVAAARGETA
jgi:succinyl-CoA synthetase beta subunit